MDFFEHQELARKKTRLLVVYFILAVLGIIASIYAVVVGASLFVGSEGAGSFSLWQPEVLLYAALGSTGVIALGTGFKTLQLSAGGSVVAAELGGRRIDRNTSDLEERRLLNVVEEMAIASGVPVPDVYIMDNEMGINAFAAGKTPSDAVIGVTRGTVRLLNRDELQGVMAHEFSHILNGDMRLNMRLIGLLFGILFIAMIGQIVMRSVMFAPRSRNRDSNGGGVLAILAFGAALMAIGYVGLFFAKLIKAAISRQREFLADASAVQFTRNPEGIAGALKKIGGLSEGSTIASPRAEEASHMFFGDAFQDKVMQMQSLATHPPLDVRIKKIEPKWDGVFPKVALPDISQSPELGGVERGARGASSSAAMVSGLSPVVAGSGVQDAFRVGEPGAEQIIYGQNLVAALSPESLSAIRGGAGAQAIIFALLLGQDDELRRSEVALLKQSVDELTVQHTLKFYAEIGDLDSSKKIGLIDLTIPSLRQLSPPEYERFQTVTQRLMESDGQIDLFEFMLQKIIRRHLDLFFNRVRPPKIRYRHLSKLSKELSILLSTLAGVGSRNQGQAILAFQEGVESVAEDLGGEDLQFMSPEECGLQQIDEALNRFDEATPLMKKRLLYACGKVVMADQKVNDGEAELLRAIADTIGCPIPPFVKAS
ncbi:MAG: M48 family metallopeptidase [Verrucomicrobiales bacterium]|nr:M48 family metallopeptidase [Verrucomicrobiales bacterium]